MRLIDADNAIKLIREVQQTEIKTEKAIDIIELLATSSFIYKKLEDEKIHTWSENRDYENGFNDGIDTAIKFMTK